MTNPWSFTYLLPALEKRLSLDRLIPDESEIRGFDAPDDMLWYSTSRFPSKLTERLVQYGLAVPRDAHSVWVKPVIHYLVFALAAEHVTSDIRRSRGFASSSNLFAYTDRERCFWIGHSPIHELDPRPCWQVEIGELLPQPAPGTSLAEVIAFRQRHDDERRELIKALGRLQDDLTRQWGNSVDVREFASDELAKAAGNLRKAALASKLRLVARSSLVFVALASTAAASAVPSIGFVLGVTAGIAVNLATGALGGMAGDREQAYTYLHRVDKTLSAG